jgi:PKD repeat protein
MKATATCPLIPVSLNDRIQESSLVIEATVISQTSYFNSKENFIYTAHELEVHKLYKGQLSSQRIIMLTEGGIVGNRMLSVQPVLETNIGQSGVFFLSPNTSWENPATETQTFYSKTGPLGFIYYNAEKTEAFDLLQSYGAIQTVFLPKLKALTGKEQIVGQINPAPSANLRRSTPVIGSFSPNTIPAGTREVLTIKGSNFGTSRGSGQVSFRNPDDGGSTFTPALETDYLSWSDTQITLLVKRQAGTGRFRVKNNDGNETTSSTNITIPWAHLNVVFAQPPLVPEQRSYEIRHRELNNSGGITWTWSQTFRNNQAAVNSFIRALESWRCNTGINWDTLGSINNDTNLRDNKSMVFFDRGWLPSSTLGVCYSWYNGCFGNPNPANMEWYVDELDIVFRRTVNWEYGPANAAGGKTDFESVALHELGHGHQLGHVINTSNVMHFSIGANTNKRVLQTNDTLCGKYIMGKSTVSVCGHNPMRAIAPGNCLFAELKADFSFNNPTPCTRDTFFFSDVSTGNISDWSWNFGPGAIPFTASGPGPHAVYYLYGGNKNITLTVNAGSIQDSKTIPLLVGTDLSPVASFSTLIKAGCKIETNVLKSVANTNYLWNFNDEFQDTGKFTSIIFPQEGSKKIKLSASNNCKTTEDSIVLDLICVPFVATPENTCLGETKTFNTTGINADQILWNFGTDAFPETALGEGPHQVLYVSGGIKNIKINVIKGQVEQEIVEQITVKSDVRPTAAFLTQHQGNQTFLFQNFSDGTNNQYKWNFGDNIGSSTEKNPLYTYNQAPQGLKVSLIATNNCSEDSTASVLSDFTSILAEESKSVFQLFPNPTEGQIFIHSSNLNAQLISFKIIDFLGKTIIEKEHYLTGTPIQIHQLNQGLYSIVIITQSGSYQKQFIKL